MRLLIFTNHFWPENFRINDLAIGLKERGHEVTVMTGVPDYPEGKFYPGYGVFKRRIEDYHGIRVMRFPLIPRGKGRSWNLVLNYLSSALMACLLAPFYCRGKYDLIFVFHTSPITIALPAILIRKIKSIPIIFWNLDLWPESISATGAIKSPKVLGLVRRMVRFVYRRIDRLLVSSRGFVESVEKTGGYSGEITYFPNWVEPEYLVEKDMQDFELPDLPEGFLVMFAGNIGAAQDFATILSAAERLKAHKDIHWVILGDGRMSDWVREQVHIYGLDNQFHMLGRFSANMMPQFFSKSDALLLTLKKEPIFTLTAPGKLQSYLASGKPIIAGLDGEGALLVNEADAGEVCPAGSPNDLANCVLTLYRMHPEERRQLGENGKRYCLAHFDRNKLFDSLEQIMADLTGTKES